MDATFTTAGADLRLDPQEYGFLHLTLSYVLHGLTLPDHDFRNILGMSRDDAERLYERMQSAEKSARAEGQHWQAGHQPSD